MEMGKGPSNFFKCPLVRRDQEEASASRRVKDSFNSMEDGYGPNQRLVKAHDSTSRFPPTEGSTDPAFSVDDQAKTPGNQHTDQNKSAEIRLELMRDCLTDTGNERCKATSRRRLHFGVL